MIKRRTTTRRGRGVRFGALAIAATALWSVSLVAIPGGPVAPASAAVGAPFGDGTPYPGPLPPVIPADGGAIQAENFNGGPAEQAFHACTPGDQGAAAAYRSDPHDIDIKPAGNGQYYIASSVAHASSDPAHDCSGPSPFHSDYVKYSFTVAQTGWYRFRAAAQNGKFWTRVDDVNLGQTGSVGPWTAVVLAPAVHLTAGPVHVLTVELLGFNVDLDSILIEPTGVYFPEPRVVPAPLTTDEVVVADAVATDAPFGAVPNNVGVDNRGPIQSALDTVGAEGGGTVFLPPGVYTVKGPLAVPANVTLRGDWSAATSHTGQTILAAKVPAGVFGKPFIGLSGTNAGVEPPEHLVSGSEVLPPVAVPGHDPLLLRVGDGQRRDAVQLRPGHRRTAAGAQPTSTVFEATCFTACIVDDGNRDFAFITNVKISNQVWATAPAQLPRKPATTSDRALLRKWTTTHLTGIHLYRNDNLTMYGITVTDAKRGIVTTSTCGGCGTYGSFSKISASLDRRGDNRAARPASNVNSIMDTDLVSQAKKVSYLFAPARSPARRGPTDFYDVRAAPFSAQADGVTDDTAAIQQALTTAGLHGGGTVYVPAGTYLVKTHLTVPAGVELRGSYSARHTSESVDGTTLLAVEGQGTATSVLRHRVHLVEPLRGSSRDHACAIPTRDSDRPRTRLRRSRTRSARSASTRGYAMSTCSTDTRSPTSQRTAPTAS